MDEFIILWSETILAFLRREPGKVRDMHTLRTDLRDEGCPRNYYDEIVGWLIRAGLVEIEWGKVYLTTKGEILAWEHVQRIH